MMDKLLLIAETQQVALNEDTDDIDDFYELIVDSNTIGTLRDRSLIQIKQFIFVYLDVKKVGHESDQKYYTV